MDDSRTTRVSVPPTRPLIIAHRGASQVAPENTMAAFKRALDAGADGIEFDVRLSSDNVPVVIHDANLRRVGLRNELVSRMTAADLAQCDVGSWFNRRFPALAQETYAAERVPTLQTFFTFIQNAAGVFYLEMKSDQGQGSALALEVSQLIRQHQLQDRVVVLSFDLDAVGELKDIDSSIRTAALFQPRLFRTGSLIRKGNMIRSALACHADEIALHRLLVMPSLVQLARAEGLNVVVWTVDNPAWFEIARRLGVHAIISNNPGAMCLRLDPHAPI